MGFNLPDPPSHMTFPESAQNWANGILGLIVLALILYAINEWRAGRGPLAVLLVAGGAISLFNEPMLDVLGPLWHPRPNQDVAFTTFGPVPVWGLFAYTLFFGGGTYVLYRQIERGITRKQLWIGLVGFWCVNLAIELPLLAADMYKYYGYDTPPMTIGGFPLYWLIINAGAPLCGACLLHAAPSAFTGLKRLRALLVPVCVYCAYSLATGWPVFSAARREDLAEPLQWAAAFLTIGIGATVIDELARWVEDRNHDASSRVLKRNARSRQPSTT